MTGSPLVSGTPEGRTDDEIRALCEAATPGPWVQNGRNGVHTPRGSCVALSHGADGASPEHDAEFIAAARSLVPSLLARVEAAQAENERLRPSEVMWPCTTAAALADPVGPRRYDQCDEMCTVDCGHCKGRGKPVGLPTEPQEQR